MKHQILNRYPIGNPRRKWRQDRFVLSQFKAHGRDMRKHIKACADVGFDTVELGWASDEQADAALLRLQSAEEEAFTVEYRLVK